MAKLSSEQTQFLKAHGISLGQMFDASGMRRKDYHAHMKAIGKDFAYGVTPCQSYGHTLRTRSGSCIQCRPAAITFQLREKRTAYVYIAGSKRLKNIKVGHSADPMKRIYDGNCAGYGGAHDWAVLVMVQVDNAPEMERAVQADLAEYAVEGDYFMGDKLTTSLECFRCGYPEAWSALQSALSLRGLYFVREPVAPEGYEF
jgi:hypothetical protein